jgi:hypothetical protein
VIARVLCATAQSEQAAGRPHRELLDDAARLDAAAFRSRYRLP